ncbi:MAG: hypothetical protein EOM12_09840, partial [Verrucomicrobiae bacterium]|nr:hypothetical protein [Verrucomicrobiae bacterium]
MGGFGSGGWYRWDTKPKLDSGLRLDINKLIRDGLIPKGSGSSMGTLTWTRTRDNSYVASIGYTVFKS